ncbi:protein LEG1 homolog [Psammomys obesus]|uniref:protein LEG1 homolog n=1 Tax=Psammomys obesus TaxID=48139 RepID=UPI002452C117|nr:protein LEG1 homolog [Psammomys obesus]
MWFIFTIYSFLFLNLSSKVLTQNPGSAAERDTDFPPFWSEVSESIDDFPVQDNKTVIHVWDYAHRLQLYKILITQSNKYFKHFGRGDTGNVLWALTLTYGKLYKSDRFSDPSNTSVCAYNDEFPDCLSPSSGWGGINFYVIILNFFAAIESGFFTNVTHEIVLLPGEENKLYFCYSVKECRESFPQAMDEAKKFFQYLQSRRQLATVNNITVYNTNENTATLLMWKAHRAAINIALSMFSDRSWYYSESDRSFTLDFHVAMELCEAAIYRAHYNSSKEFLVGFPHRLLNDGEYTVFVRDFSKREKALLAAVMAISNTVKTTGGWLSMTWNMAMITSGINRALGRFLINKLLLIPRGSE